MADDPSTVAAESLTFVAVPLEIRLDIYKLLLNEDRTTIKVTAMNPDDEGYDEFEDHTYEE